ncbi:MAG: DUF3192 domain-containing protein [Alphaproteobacteria bacterium]|nr:MAG: DUF3192 domain-containing protein [Alphaproteobacteria bacterium]
MKKRIISLICSFVVLLTLTACGVAAKNRSDDVRAKLNELEIGMTKEQVLRVMGKPYKRELYGKSEYFIYETDHWATVDQDKYTPIYLENGKVRGWGSSYYDNSIKQKIDADIKIKTN